MKPQKTKREEILDKIDNRLRKIEKDSNVLDYNYYNDKNFVGVKMTKKTTGVTLNGLAKTVNQLSKDLATLTKTVTDLVKVVAEGFAEQKKFNAEQRIINEEQRKFNDEQKKYNKKIDNIEVLVELMASTPTMKKELEELKKKK